MQLPALASTTSPTLDSQPYPQLPALPSTPSDKLDSQPKTRLPAPASTTSPGLDSQPYPLAKVCVICLAMPLQLINGIVTLAIAGPRRFF